jgi:TolA-binding protein
VKSVHGIFQDGLNIKLAHLVKDKGVIRIQNLGETTLSAQLYSKKEVERVPATELIDEEMNIPDSSEFEGGEFDLPEISEYDELESSKPVEEIEEFKEEEESSIAELQKFLSNFSLERGRISLNASEEEISYHSFDSPLSLSAVKKRAKSEILSEGELKSKKYGIGCIPNYDGTTLAFLHRGEFDLLNAILEIRPFISKKRFVFSYIDTNEIALMNLVRANYDFPEDDYVLIIYVGFEFKVGIVMKNNTHVKTFKIIGNTVSKSESIRQVVYSKIILEQDVSNIPPAQHLILTGEMVSDEDIKFFSKKFGKTTDVSRFEFKNINVNIGNGDYLPETIAKYAIPISLALKTVDPKNKAFYDTNLLPAKIIESQKRFKLGWHGLLLFVAIFYFAYSGTVRNLENKQQIVEIQRQNYNMEAELRRSNLMLIRINELSQQISNLEKNIEKIRAISGSKNQWHRILKALSDTFLKNSISWISSLKSESDGFIAQGVSNRKENIATISKHFPGCILSDVKTSEIQSIPVLGFLIDFPYPEYEELVVEIVEPPQILPGTEKVTTPSPVIQERKPISVANSQKSPETQPAWESSQTPATRTTKEVLPSDMYKEAVGTYLSGNLQEGYNKFRQFVAKHPDAPLAYNANYFIGECLFQMGEIEKAKNVFEEILRQGGSKTPDALLMLGRCYNAINDPARAIDYWGMLITRFPEHRLAKIAEVKVKQVLEE